ncbi:MAG: hypothetical protein JSU60_06955 [Nitrospirota bacterium]|nr:MAG: hypothetical protein JSU60_06955 [Nitrospirota bacterium]
MYDLRISPLLKWYSLVLLLGLLSSPCWASDPFGNSTLIPNNNSPKDMAFDQVNWKRVQGVFSWITMARGYSDTPWDSSSGRPGWMTMEDAYVQPIDPGVSEFSSDTEIFYIVFEGQPLDAPAQFAAAWFEMKDGNVKSNTPVGKDVIELDMNQRFGYFEIFPPEQGWKLGNYLVKIFYGSPGQDLHAINVVGTMQFTIK